MRTSKHFSTPLRMELRLLLKNWHATYKPALTIIRQTRIGEMRTLEQITGLLLSEPHIVNCSAAHWKT